MKRVLLVAFHYPPEGGSSGVLRTLKFSKYLSAYGWEPQVLTMRESVYTAQDPGLLGQIPAGVKVHRTGGFDSAKRFSIRGRYLAALTVPDRYVSWYPFAVRAGGEIIRREGIAAIYSTSPVPTAHLIAATLRAGSKLPWIADFRDPWVEEGIHPRPGSLRYHVEKRMEASVLRQADRVTVTTPELGEELRSRYPGLTEERVRVIYNGFDEEDFEDLPPPDRSEQMEIVHAGLLTREFRDPFPLLAELATLLAEGAIPRTAVRIVFLGSGGWASSADFRSRVDALGLGDVVRVEERIPHRDSLRRQARAAALLLLQASDDTRHLIPAKAFEYLRLGRPIIALTLPGATARVLRSATHCHVLEPGDARGLREGLLDVHRLWRSGSSAERYVPGPDLLAYERNRLTGTLAGILDELVPASAGHRSRSQRHV